MGGRDMRRIYDRLEGYDGLYVDSRGRSGGLAFLWKRTVDCRFLSSSMHHMDFSVHIDGREWRVTGFYGWPEVSNRYLSWSEIFPFACAYHLDREWSDHAPTQLVLDRRGVEERPTTRLFRFEQIWTEDHRCEDLVRRVWDAGDISIMVKQDRCGEELMSLKENSFGAIKKELTKKICQLKRMNEGLRTDTQIQRRKKLIFENAKLLRQEELFWRQRSCILWLAEGDRNTKFFHRRAGQRKQKNHISSILDKEGRMRNDENGISDTVKDYFQSLFHIEGSVDTTEVLTWIEERVTEDVNEVLRREYKAEEVVEALGMMHPLKAPGPDGMNALFFQTYWHIIGESVVDLFLSILRGMSIPRELNTTFLALIPKKKGAENMGDYRPNSLCNVIYKLVSKVLANRLKNFLDKVVSENQSAFVPRRLISDNILVAFEVFHHMNER